MNKLILAAAILASPALAADEAPAPPTPASVVEAAKPSEWKAIDPADLLVMDLAPDAKGNKRQVIIQLMPPPFSQGWVDNIRTLARAHWWDGTSVYRAVDNWVVQWGDGEGEDPAKAKPLPKGLKVVPESEYVAPATKAELTNLADGASFGASGLAKTTSFLSDPYASLTTFYEGWPIATSSNAKWPTHCYGTVGVARDLSPDTGTGAELYSVIGQAPRQLDRNIAVVGRVIEGIENLSTLPRGKGDHGVYADKSLRVPIISVRLGSDLPTAEQPHFEYLDTGSKSFAEYVHVSANRNDAFYKVPAGGIALCNVKVPIRRVPGE
ncbi:peptidylprolyl isomerase [Tsuneonella mangrovi]|uniref:peptidylprolyl isomerase n=1 Tax=Tsuneonella mangrovi TaxID=1982042 RepID=UPI000BA1C556|nr:peptidylprolyl isomerase [Tsuneonella mangrovi]